MCLSSCDDNDGPRCTSAALGRGEGARGGGGALQAPAPGAATCKPLACLGRVALPSSFWSIRCRYAYGFYVNVRCGFDSCVTHSRSSARCTFLPLCTHDTRVSSLLPPRARAAHASPTNLSCDLSISHILFAHGHAPPPPARAHVVRAPWILVFFAFWDIEQRAIFSHQSILLRLLPKTTHDPT